MRLSSSFKSNSRKYKPKPLAVVHNEPRPGQEQKDDDSNAPNYHWPPTQLPLVMNNHQIRRCSPQKQRGRHRPRRWKRNLQMLRRIPWQSQHKFKRWSTPVMSSTCRGIYSSELCCTTSGGKRRNWTSFYAGGSCKKETCDERTSCVSCSCWERSWVFSQRRTAKVNGKTAITLKVGDAGRVAGKVADDQLEISDGDSDGKNSSRSTSKASTTARVSGED